MKTITIQFFDNLDIPEGTYSVSRLDGSNVDTAEFLLEFNTAAEEYRRDPKATIDAETEITQKLASKWKIDYLEVIQVSY